jgi:hypothetical protein
MNRYVFIFILFSFVMFEVGADDSNKNNSESYIFSKCYELYSWKADSGEWNFSVFGTCSHNRTQAEVTDPEMVLSNFTKFKDKIKKLPKGSSLVWFDHLDSKTSTRAKEVIQYPPKDIYDEVLRFAKECGIKVIV